VSRRRSCPRQRVDSPRYGHVKLKRSTRWRAQLRGREPVFLRRSCPRQRVDSPRYGHVKLKRSTRWRAQLRGREPVSRRRSCPRQSLCEKQIAIRVFRKTRGSMFCLGAQNRQSSSTRSNRQRVETTCLDAVQGACSRALNPILRLPAVARRAKAGSPHFVVIPFVQLLDRVHVW
jgi:hypothetical protein